LDRTQFPIIKGIILTILKLLTNWSKRGTYKFDY